MNFCDDELGPWITEARPRNVSQKTVSAAKTEQKELLRSILSGRRDKLPSIRSSKNSNSPTIPVKQQFFNKFLILKELKEQPHHLPKHHLLKMRPKLCFPRIKEHSQQQSLLHEQIVGEIEKIIRRNQSHKPKFSYF